MPYTFVPKEKHAKAFGSNIRISYRTGKIICDIIRKKKLTTVKRLLVGLLERRRSLKGKYYTKTVEGIMKILDSCEKNAVSQGLDVSRLFVYASSHKGRVMRRRRRKASYGSLLKTANVEVLLVEK